MKHIFLILLAGVPLAFGGAATNREPATAEQNLIVRQPAKLSDVTLYFVGHPFPLKTNLTATLTKPIGAVGFKCEGKSYVASFPMRDGTNKVSVSVREFNVERRAWESFRGDTFQTNKTYKVLVTLK